MRDMAASSGVAHVGAPAQRPAAPRIAGIVKPERPANVGVSSACRSATSGTTKCPMSGAPRP